jgi:hypothetical protein
MALMIDVEEYCVFKKNQEKLANGHNPKRCQQCGALRSLAISVNNKTLDMISEVYKHTKPEVVFSASDVAKHIDSLKTVQ